MNNCLLSIVYTYYWCQFVILFSVTYTDCQSIENETVAISSITIRIDNRVEYREIQFDLSSINNSDNRFVCQWNIITNTNEMTMNIRFEYIHLRVDIDQLLIYDQTQLIQSCTGDQCPQVVSTKPIITIILNSTAIDNHSNNYGFKAIINASYNRKDMILLPPPSSSSSFYDRFFIQFIKHVIYQWWVILITMLFGMLLLSIFVALYLIVTRRKNLLKQCHHWCHLRNDNTNEVHPNIDQAMYPELKRNPPNYAPPIADSRRPHRPSVHSSCLSHFEPMPTIKEEEPTSIDDQCHSSPISIVVQ